LPSTFRPFGNFRDISYIPNKYAKNVKIKEGVIFRSASLSRHDIKIVETFLKENNINFILDLRGLKELEEYSEYDNVYRGEFKEKYVIEVPFEPSVDTYIPSNLPLNFYYAVLREFREKINLIFQNYFSNAINERLIIHCEAGKDRTGIIIALLLDLIGIKREYIIEDYLFSRSDTKRKYIEFLLETIDNEYGSTEKYLVDYCNTPKETIVTIRNSLIDHSSSGSWHDLPGDKTSRKKQGQYYTDPIIVRFMLSNLDLKQLENKSLVDPACGYGIFLEEYYNIAKNTMIQNGYNEDTVHEKLLNNIWGFDIDPIAVQIASNKLISKNSRESSRECNIFYFNSLKDEKKKAFNREFDFIVGNPPFYIVDSTKQPIKAILNTGYYDKILSNNLNIASMFLFKYIKQLKEHGQLAFVFPRSFIHVNSFNTLRKEVLSLKIQNIYDLGKAFEDVGLEHLIIVLKNENPSNNQIHYGLLDFDKKNNQIIEKLSYQIPQDYFLTTNNYVFEVFSGKKAGTGISGLEIKKKMEKMSKGNSVLDYSVLDIKRGLGIQKNSTKSREKNSDLIIIGGRSIFNFGKKSSDTYKYVAKNQIIKPKMTIKAELNLFKPKIMLQNLVSSKIRIVGCFDEAPISFIKEDNEKPIYMLTFDTITNIYLKDLRYARFILGILLSELTTYYLRDIILVRATLTLHLDKKYLQKIPIVDPDNSQLNEIDSIVRKLEAFVQEKQQLYPVRARERPKWENPNHQDYHDYKELVDELNEKIYDLYNITSEEIAFIKAQLTEFGKYY